MKDLLAGRKVMLAIVFWSARRKNVSADHYAESLVGFHRALKSIRPAGFRFSASYRVDWTPWFKPQSEIYEDWYVLSNFSAVDALDDAVLHSDGMDAHRRLMNATAEASGAIFGLTNGPARLEGLPEATWFLKPPNMTVDELMLSTKAQLPDGKCSLWTRALALGPIEHCLLSSSKVELPKNYQAVRANRELFWHSSLDR